MNEIKFYFEVENTERNNVNNDHPSVIEIYWKFIIDTTTTGASTSNTFYGLTTGTSYTFTVAAINVQGTGPASNSFSFFAADVPSQIDKVVVSQTAGSTQVSFKWTQPLALNGLLVTSYKLLFYQTNGSQYKTKHIYHKIRFWFIIISFAMLNWDGPNCFNIRLHSRSVHLGRSDRSRR